MPQQLRVFINLPSSADFSDAEETRPHLDVSLQENEAGMVEYPLRAPAFTNVNSITLFFVSRIPSTS